MAEYFELTRAPLEETNEDGFARIRLQIECTAALNSLSTAIFRYLPRHNPTTDVLETLFDGVCSSLQMEELPIGAPHPTADPAYFRLPQLDIKLGSRAEAEEVWSLIEVDVQHLSESYYRAETLELVETQVFEHE